ncbi:MAG TPA: ribosome small subunit-dependent GTPase A [Candidatus Limnocylindrales bacterium]|nr:ribosome small subunit-dependent GTPase A [Candidatus Limnocylindrales bacterium]
MIELGWGKELEAGFAPYGAQGHVAGRVVTVHRGVCRVRTAEAELDIVVQRGFRRAAAGSGGYPAVGDWVALEPFGDGSGAALRAILPRRSAFTRKVAGLAVTEQVVAANVDVVLLVASLNHEFNARRLERYLALAWTSGAEPVVVLSKLDLCPDPGPYLAQVREIAPTVSTHPVSGVTGQGLDGLNPYMGPGRTVALLGSSGVGKSTIANALLGWERQHTAAIREDDARGRHTTSVRELIVLPTGGILIDTPGMREIQLWEAEDGVETVFDDISALAADCRFGDCRHVSEPGCAVLAAIADGSLARERLESQRKLERELRSLERRQNPPSSRAGQRKLGRLYRDASKVAMRRSTWEAD